MRATCPSCEATYEVPDRLIGAGRRLRCTNCGHAWTLLPAVAEAPPAEPEPAPPPPPSASASAPRSEPPPSPAAAAPVHPVLRRAPQVIHPPLPPVDDTRAPRRGGTAPLRAAWIGSVLLVLLALGVLWTFRAEIATAWPPAARLVGTPTGGG